MQGIPLPQIVRRVAPKHANWRLEFSRLDSFFYMFFLILTSESRTIVQMPVFTKQLIPSSVTLREFDEFTVLQTREKSSFHPSLTEEGYL